MTGSRWRAEWLYRPDSRRRLFIRHRITQTSAETSVTHYTRRPLYGFESVFERRDQQGSFAR